MHTPARPLILVGLLAALAPAEQVPLPYLAPADGNCQWVLQPFGVLQNQGNQPVFSQTGMLMINGQQMQRNAATAELDEKNKELTITYNPNGPVRVTRRLKFADNGVVRIVDVFDNPIDREASVNVGLMTNTNFGVNDSQPIVDPKKKDVTLGWAANTGAERAALSLFGGKGAKAVPNVPFQPNTNQVNASMVLKVPAKGRRALVHWHGSFENADAAVAWAGQLKESREVADLPADVRSALVNVASGGGALPEGLELLRGTPTADVVELKTGDVLRGELDVPTYTLATPRGETVVPATNVAGVVSVDGRQWLVTTAGEVLAGRMTRGDVRITLAGGQTPTVPIDRVARIGYRSATAEPPEWKTDTAAAFLSDGQRFAVTPLTGKIELATRYGPLSLPADRVAAILTPASAATQTIYLADGSRLGGVLTSPTIALATTAGPATRPADFSPAELSRVVFKTLPDDVGVGVATAGLLGDDRVAARIMSPIKLATGFETITLPGDQIRGITRPRPGGPDVLVTTADGSTFRGTPEGRTIDLATNSGFTLSVPVAALRDYDNPTPDPSAGVVAKAQDAVKRLNSDDFQTREAAEAELSATGPSIVGVLERTLAGQPPEAKDRITAVLRKLKKDAPTPPSRLTPVPPLDL